MEGSDKSGFKKKAHCNYLDHIRTIIDNLQQPKT